MSDDKNAKDRFDYNRVETVKFQKEMEKKKKELLERGRPDIQLVPIPRVSLKTIAATVVGILSVSLVYFLNYPEPPLSPILFQWQSLGKTFEHKGYEIFYLDFVNPNPTTIGPDNKEVKENLVILHGFPTSSFDFHLIYPNLTKIYQRIIAPDFIGFGFSAKPRSYSYSLMDQTDLVVELVERLQLKSVNLLAHDYGDTVAQELLARHKEKSLSFDIRSVCMLNGGVFPALHTPTMAQRLFRISILRTILAKLSNFYFFSHSLNKVFGPHTQASYTELQDFWKLVRLNDGYRVFPDLLSYIDERFRNEHRWIEALKTEVPLHFIYGPADPVNPAPIFEKTFRGIVGDKITVLPHHIGHYPQIEAPFNVVSAYQSFVTGVFK